MKTDIFILAHQDDEIAIFKSIKNSVKSDNNTFIFYLTNGNNSKTDNLDLVLKRENESKNVLAQLGVNLKNIFFLGHNLNIKSYEIFNFLDIIYEKLINVINSFDNEVIIYTHAWEGGNIDHDSCFILGLKLIRNNSKIIAGYQFPFYNSYKIPFHFYRVFCPIKLNGNAVNLKISKIEKIHFIKYLFYYPTQIKIWIGLYPFIIFKILFNKFNYLQKIDKAHLLKKPHEGSLWYEKQKFMKFEKIILLFNSFLK